MEGIYIVVGAVARLKKDEYDLAVFVYDKELYPDALREYAERMSDERTIILSLSHWNAVAGLTSILHHATISKHELEELCSKWELEKEYCNALYHQLAKHIVHKFGGPLANPSDN